jgi:hypothetical protein
MPGRDLPARAAGYDCQASVTDEIHAAGMLGVRPAGLGEIAGDARIMRPAPASDRNNHGGGALGCLCHHPLVMAVMMGKLALMAVLAVMGALAGVRRRAEEGGKRQRKRHRRRKQPCRPSLFQGSRHSRSISRFPIVYARLVRKHQGGGVLGSNTHP